MPTGDTSSNFFNASGTTAQRLAFTPNPGTPTPTPPQGYTFWDQTLQTLYSYDSVLGWVAVGGSGSSGAGYVDHRLLGGI